MVFILEDENQKRELINQINVSIGVNDPGQRRLCCTRNIIGIG